jgi:FkbM family methyltransferase
MNRNVRILRKAIRLVYGHRTIAIPGEGAARLRIPPAEYPSLCLGVWRFEPRIKQRWKALLAPGEIIFDIGANIGITVQRFHALLSGACVIYAFEPLPRNVALLRKNSAVLHGRIQVIEVAVGNTDGHIHFEDNLDHGALSRMSSLGTPSQQDRDFWQHSSSIEVQLVTLDRYCTYNPEAMPTFIKLDVEGAGHWVMQGAQSTLSQYKPVVSCSFHGQEEQEGILEVLASQGYRGIQVDAGGTLSWCGLAESEGEFGHPDCARIASRIKAAVLASS